jgi:hypothetical protein
MDEVKISGKWELIIIILTYKYKEIPLECEPYLAIMLLEHGMNALYGQ